MTAAVRNLESLAIDGSDVTLDMAEGLSKRENRSDMFELMSSIFRRSNPSEAREVLKTIDADPQEVQLWVDENLPYEYNEPGDLVRGYEKLSRGDIFLGRVHKRQYYRFWAYANDLDTMGVATARMTSKVSHGRINFPSYLSKMSKSRSVRNMRAAVVMKLATALHTSTRRAEMDILPYMRIMLKNDISLRASVAESMSLEPEELAFIIGSKPDSKDIKKIYDDIATRAEERRIASSMPVKHVSGPLDKLSEPEPVSEPVQESKVEPEPPKQAQHTDSRPKGQKSLFDF